MRCIPRECFLLFASVLSFLFTPSFLLSQSQITTGVIQGVVVDESGGVVPGAKVTLAHSDTGFRRELISDDGGRFTALLMPLGAYRITVEQSGFATLERVGVTLTVGQTANLTLTMKVAGTATRIEVTSEAPPVDTTNTAGANTLNQLTVNTTPLVGRKFESLITLTPGVSIVQGPDGNEINFNGQRGINNNISVDGGDYNNPFFGEQLGGQRTDIGVTLEAVKEFQVIAQNAAAEFGRSSGGFVNVVTKSGTNDYHGNLFYFQRHEKLTRKNSDGTRQKDFHREQLGGTIGGPIVQSKAFYFFAFEQIIANLTRPNLSEPFGDPAGDAQRIKLLNFFKARYNADEGQPVKHPIRNTALLGKVDWNLSEKHQLAATYNFARSRKENETFDVRTYGTSANGIEGPSRIQPFNVSFNSALSANLLNEFHFTYVREARPRGYEGPDLPDTGVGFAPSFRFGRPFFLPVEELFWRFQFKDNFSVVKGKHNLKFGFDYNRTANDQVFIGFARGRYLFSDVDRFIDYATNGPTAANAGSLLFYLDFAGVNRSIREAGATNIRNNEIAWFVQDKLQLARNFTLSLGLRHEVQLMPEPLVDPSKTYYASLIGKPGFPSDGTVPDQINQWQPRVGLAWEPRGDGKEVLRLGFGIFNARTPMLEQVGPLNTNGAIATGNFRDGTFPLSLLPRYPNVLPAPTGLPFSPIVRVFAKDYKNPRTYTANIAYEREFYPNWVGYFDFTWSKGVYLTRFIDANNPGPDLGLPLNGDTHRYGPNIPFGDLFPFGQIVTTTSSAKSLYEGWTFGMRKRYSNRFQFEWNYVYSFDNDDDSNERDPFFFRYFNYFNFKEDYSLSDRDIRHKFNFFGFAQLPGGLEFNGLVSIRSAQPITPSPRVLNGIDRGRNSIRKDNAFSSFDWRLQRPFQFGDRYKIILLAEMFNTFNRKNNLNPLITPALFNFDGFLRSGIGDPLTAQLGVKFHF